jgi:hypothetical protein
VGRFETRDAFANGVGVNSADAKLGCLVDFVSIVGTPATVLGQNEYSDCGMRRLESRQVESQVYSYEPARWSQSLELIAKEVSPPTKTSCAKG